MTQPHPAAVRILSVRLDAVTLDEAVTMVDGYIAARTPHQIVTVNPEFVVQARGDAAFRTALEQADLALPDGVGLVWAARVLGTPLRGRVTGVDLVDALAARAVERGHRLFLLGGAGGVAEAAAAVLQSRYPAVRVAGCYAGSPRPDEEADIVERVQSVRPDVLLVAYGAPAQDVWGHRNLAALGVPVVIGVGGTFDYLSGRVARAPGWVRRAGFEWLYRLVRQPWRWRRQLRLPVFVALVLRQRLTRRA